MLTAGILLTLLACMVGGWQFMCDASPPFDRPGLARDNIPLLIAIPLALIGIVLLFFAKWYAGLIGIVGVIVGLNVFAAIWHAIYRKFHL